MALMVVTVVEQISRTIIAQNVNVYLVCSSTLPNKREPTIIYLKKQIHQHDHILCNSMIAIFKWLGN